MSIVIVVEVGPEDVLDCPLCGARAVVALTPDQLAQQPDDTTLVCHPALGGCNHGFALDCGVAMGRQTRDGRRS